MMMKKRNIVFGLLLFLMILSACTAQTPSPSPVPQQPSGGLVTKDKAPFALAAKAALSQKLGIPQDQVGFVSAEAVEWTDSCLGLGGPAESCLQAVTPGYRVTLSAEGKQYEVRTDETGAVVRIPE
jgi:hypothetical protein